jgi:transcriptional regulator of acetoin/glycerol metabolism
MSVPVAAPQTSLQQVIDQILSSHKITRHDQQLLMAMFSQGALNIEEQTLFNRVYEALRKGLLRVMD